MILTQDILDQGRNKDGGWNRASLRALGFKRKEMPPRWMEEVIGKNFSKKVIDNFLAGNSRDNRSKRRTVQLLQSFISSPKKSRTRASEKDRSALMYNLHPETIQIPFKEILKRTATSLFVLFEDGKCWIRFSNLRGKTKYNVGDKDGLMAICEWSWKQLSRKANSPTSFGSPP